MILRSLGWATAALAALAAAGIAMTRPFGYDLVVYLEAARRLTAGAPLYPLAAHDAPVWTAGEYLYPPTTAAAFIPLATLPNDTATALWTAVLLVLAAALGYVLIRPLAAAIRPWAFAGYVLYLPLVAELTLGNLDLIALALSLIAVSARTRERVAGPALGLALGSKLLPLALPFFFVGARLWRTLAVTALVGLGAVVVTLPWLGDTWLTYGRLMSRLAGAPAAQAATVVPAGVPAPQLVLPAVAVGVGLLAGFAARDRDRATIGYATALAAVPLAAPGIWYPYLVFALPLFAALLRAPSRWTLAGTIVAFAIVETPKRPDGSYLAFYGLTLLIALGLERTLRGHPARRSTDP